MSLFEYFTSKNFLLATSKTFAYEAIELARYVTVYFFFKSMFGVFIPNLNYPTPKRQRVRRFIIMLFILFAVNTLIAYITATYFDDLTPDTIKIASQYGPNTVIAFLILKIMKLEYGVTKVELPGAPAADLA